MNEETVLENRARIRELEFRVMALEGLLESEGIVTKQEIDEAVDKFVAELNK